MIRPDPRARKRWSMPLKKSAAKWKYPFDNPRLSQEERTAAYNAFREKLDRSLHRKIEAWAAVFEHCPVSGCRRNARCLHRAECRAVSHEPMTEAERLAIGRELRRVIAEERGEPPLPDLSPNLRAWATAEPSAD